MQRNDETSAGDAISVYVEVNITMLQFPKLFGIDNPKIV